jgi:hypothetical protein
MTALSGWENFYVIVGSSAGALIGLQFVVMTLIAEVPIAGSDSRAGAAFGTPTVVHFGAVLLLSALTSVPWERITIIAVLWGLIGLCGISYSLLVARRLRSQTAYQLVFEDQLCHVLLPLVSYANMTIAGAVAFTHSRAALFTVAAAALLLLFIGIHNAWDAIMYQVFVKRSEKD